MKVIAATGYGIHAHKCERRRSYSRDREIQVVEGFTALFEAEGDIAPDESIINHRAVLYIVLSVAELLFVGGLFALSPLFLSVAYCIQTKKDPSATKGLRKAVLASLCLVAIVGSTINLYTLISAFVGL